MADTAGLVNKNYEIFITVQYPSQLQLFIPYIWRIRNSNYSQIVKSAEEKAAIQFFHSNRKRLRGLMCFLTVQRIPLQHKITLQRNPQKYC